MHYMLIANLQCVSIDIYVNADMIIIMNNDDLLNLLMICSLKVMIKPKLIILYSVYSLHRDCMEMM